MLATGHVHILQGAATSAPAGGARFEDEDTIVLSDNPILHLQDGTSQTPGPHGKFVYHRGQGLGGFGRPAAR